MTFVATEGGMGVMAVKSFEWYNFGGLMRGYFGISADTQVGDELVRTVGHAPSPESVCEGLSVKLRVEWMRRDHDPRKRYFRCVFETTNTCRGFMALVFIRLARDGKRGEYDGNDDIIIVVTHLILLFRMTRYYNRKCTLPN